MQLARVSLTGKSNLAVTALDQDETAETRFFDSATNQANGLGQLAALLSNFPGIEGIKLIIPV